MFTDEEIARGRTVNDTKVERDAGHANLRNYGGSPATIAWGYNRDMDEAGLVLIQIGKEKAILSVEQLQRYLRWV